MLVVQNLTKKYGKLTAVDSLSLTIEKGSIFGFIGPNGAGKTTTMKIIATLLRPTSGNVWIAGEEINRNPGKIRKLIGYMPDFFGVYDDLKVSEYLDFYAASYGIPPSKRKDIIGDLLELVDLSHKQEAYVDSLSRGMKQRLCLARSLVHDPQLLILDEPASGLDPRARLEVREILKELKAMGKTIIVSSHILPELADICTHMGIIEAGKMVIEGPVDEIMLRSRGKGYLEVKVLDRIEEARTILEQNFYISNIIIDGNMLKFPFAGDDREVSGILTGLVQGGISVASFARAKGNLEEIFMQLTKGVVQ